MAPFYRRAVNPFADARIVSVGVAVLGLLGAPAARASTCYQQPFGNPNLADGWHSTCCGRTNPHQGVDYPQKAGTPIPSVADGTIAKVTSTPCLGNVVVVAHPDGMFSGYCHMNSTSPLAVGTPVQRGQTIGYVGATGNCANGAHLHLTMASGVDGYGNGNNVDPNAYIEAHKQCNSPPKGALDQADCDVVRGWAFDAEAGATPIAVSLSFGGPATEPTSHVLTLTAGQKRDDVCATVGSCNHGFSLLPPYSLFDGEAHPVHAYGVDVPGGESPQLGNSPRALTCPAPLPTGVKRELTTPEVLAAWRFDPFQDRAPVDEKVVEMLPEGPVMPTSPETVRGASDSVYLLDGARKRSIGSLAILAAWHLNESAIKTLSDFEIAQIPDGPPLRPRPLMVKDAKGRTSIIDDAVASTSAGGGPAGQAGAGGMTTSVGGAATSANGGAAGTTSSEGGKAGQGGVGKRGPNDEGPRYVPVEGEDGGSCALAMPSSSASRWAGTLLALAAVSRLARRRRS